MNLVCEGIRFAYPRRDPVLVDLGFSIDGGLVALLGENGAGKSTLMSILATQPPAGRLSGTVRIGGVAVAPGTRRRIRRDLGWVPQEFPFDPAQRVGAAVGMVARLRGMARPEVGEAVAAALALVGLEDRADRRLGELSGGLRRRAVIAAGIVHRPRVVLLDEPTAGLDPANRRRIMEILARGAESGMTVLFSTHLAADAAGADRVLFLSGGGIVEDAAPETLVRRHGGIDEAFVALGGDPDA